MKMQVVYIWQILPASKIWRFQTDNPGIARKLRRTQNWSLVSSGITAQHWIFEKFIRNPQKAREKLRSLTRTLEIKKDAVTGGYFAEIYPNKTPNKESYLA